MENKPPSVVRVTMNPSAKQYDVLPGQNLLEAGLSAGIGLPFGCANGSCGDCQARVLVGQVKKTRNHDFVISAAEKLAGHCLLCSTTAVTDVQLDVPIATSINDIPEQHLKAKLCHIEHNQDIHIISFKFTRGKALRFLPGQRATVGLANGSSFVLPIASCPCNAQYAEFHLTPDTVQIDVLTWFAEKAAHGTERERVSISGPTGEFTLSSATHNPRLFICEGGEFGQLQGMVEQVLNDERDIPCFLLWRATDKVGLYRLNLCRSWRDAFDHFHFEPVQHNTDVISALPVQWLTQFKHCEVYLGRKSSTLVQRLVELGVERNSIYYP